MGREDESMIVSGTTVAPEENEAVVDDSGSSRRRFFDFFFFAAGAEVDEDETGTEALPFAAKISSMTDLGMNTKESGFITQRKKKSQDG